MFYSAFTRVSTPTKYQLRVSFKSQMIDINFHNFWSNRVARSHKQRRERMNNGRREEDEESLFWGSLDIETKGKKLLSVEFMRWLMEKMHLNPLTLRPPRVSCRGLRAFFLFSLSTSCCGFIQNVNTLLAFHYYHALFRGFRSLY
jgi:hypothetical protein